MALKRLVDLVCSIVLLILLSPVMLATALLVYLSLGRPVMFRQVRIGQGEKKFTLYKFRSMKEPVSIEAGDDQRLTRLGAWIRKYSLDELPQLLNVARGDMSLVGPRPLLPEYLPLYSPEQRRRHEVKPRITGWAQVKGRNALTWERKFELDITYVDNRSPWLDARILFLTILQVLRPHGVSHQGHCNMPPFQGQVDRFVQEEL